MALDICVIILTAFAIFGGFCMLETIMQAVNSVNMPPSVIFVLKGENIEENYKIQLLSEDIPNSKIVFMNKEFPCTTCCENCEISKIIKDVLFTKNI